MRGMRAYVFMQTKLGASKDIIEYLAKNHEERFRNGTSLFGWYDAIAEFEVQNTQELNRIVSDLKHNYTSINHIGTVFERNDTCNSLKDLRRGE